MAADGDAGLVNVAVGLRVARLDHLVDVDARGRGVLRELVREPDVDVAVGGFGKLRHLGRFGAAEIPHAVAASEVRALVEVEHGLVEGNGTLGASGRESADELRVLAKIGEDTAGEHALGGEDKVEVGALGQARALFEHGLPARTGCADGQGGFVRNERARGQVCCERARRVIHPPKVGAGLVVNEEGNHENHGVGARNRVGVVGRRAQFFGRHELGEQLTEVRFTRKRFDTLVNELNGGRVDINSDDVVAF